MLVGSGIAILAAVGPAWRGEMRRARAAECPVNLELIAAAQLEIREQGGRYLSCPRTPTSLPGEEAEFWVSSADCWARFGFLPDVALRGRYTVDAGLSSFTATCELDLDGDGDAMVWVATDQRTAMQLPDRED